MDIQAVLNAITTVGFPIVAAIALGVFIAYLFKTRIGEMQELLKDNQQMAKDIALMRQDIDEIKQLLQKKEG